MAAPLTGPGHGDDETIAALWRLIVRIVVDDDLRFFAAAGVLLVLTGYHY